METNYINILKKYLNGEATHAEIRLLIDWLQSKDFQNWTDQEWEKSGNELSMDFNPQKRHDILNRIKDEIIIINPKHTLRRDAIRIILRAAAIVLLVIGTGTAAYRLANKQNQLTDMIVSAEKGQRATTTLPDGSVVWLNADSKIVFGNRFNKKERIVYVEGEAYFEVKENKNRSFIVETPALKVKVYGTSFNVNTYDEIYTKVALLEGSVQILTENESFMLKPDEMVIYNSETNETVIEHGNMDDSINWKFDALTFKDETLSSIMKQLERKFNLEIHFENEAIKDRRFSGDFSQNESIEQIFEIMSFYEKFEFSIQANNVIIY